MFQLLSCLYVLLTLFTRPFYVVYACHIILRNILADGKPDRETVAVSWGRQIKGRNTDRQANKQINGQTGTKEWVWQLEEGLGLETLASVFLKHIVWFENFIPGSLFPVCSSLLSGCQPLGQNLGRYYFLFFFSFWVCYINSSHLHNPVTHQHLPQLSFYYTYILLVAYCKQRNIILDPPPEEMQNCTQ